MSCSLRIGVLPAALRDCAAVPDVQVRLVEFRHTRDLTAAMEAGQADLAVGPPRRSGTGWCTRSGPRNSCWRRHLYGTADRSRAVRGYRPSGQ